MSAEPGSPVKKVIAPIQGRLAGRTPAAAAAATNGTRGAVPTVTGARLRGPVMRRRLKCKLAARLGSPLTGGGGAANPPGRPDSTRRDGELLHEHYSLIW